MCQFLEHSLRVAQQKNLFLKVIKIKEGKGIFDKIPFVKIAGLLSIDILAFWGQSFSVSLLAVWGEFRTLWNCDKVFCTKVA